MTTEYSYEAIVAELDKQWDAIVEGDHVARDAGTLVGRLQQ